MASEDQESTENRTNSRFPTEYQQYFETLGKTGTNTKLKCTQCNLSFIGSGTRAMAHLAGGILALASHIKHCPAVDKDTKKQVNDFLQEKARHKREREYHAALQRGDLEEEEDVDMPCRKKTQKPLLQTSVKCINAIAKTEVDEILAKGLISAGISLRCLRNKHIREAIRKIGEYGKGYEAPSNEVARKKLATQVELDVRRRVDELKDLIGPTGGTIADDGWKDCASQSLLNGVFVFTKGAIYLRTNNVTGMSLPSFLVSQLYHLLQPLLEHLLPTLPTQVKRRTIS